eukprot:780783-Pelagomonas_calceolata.AAC.3
MIKGKEYARLHRQVRWRWAKCAMTTSAAHPIGQLFYAGNLHQGKCTNDANSGPAGTTRLYRNKESNNQEINMPADMPVSHVNSFGQTSKPEGLPKH